MTAQQTIKQEIYNVRDLSLGGYMTSFLWKMLAKVCVLFLYEDIAGSSHDLFLLKSVTLDKYTHTWSYVGMFMT